MEKRLTDKPETCRISVCKSSMGIVPISASNGRNREAGFANWLAQPSSLIDD